MHTAASGSKGCKSDFVTFCYHVVRQARLQLVIKYFIWLAMFCPIKNVLRYVACTGITRLQNRSWPLILLFDTPTYTLLTPKKHFFPQIVLLNIILICKAPITPWVTEHNNRFKVLEHQQFPDVSMSCMHFGYWEIVLQHKCFTHFASEIWHLWVILG